MLRTEKQITTFLLLALLILNAVVRFYDLSNFSLSNDELSAITRLNYDSLAELIQKGVIATDPHPAGVQVFLYYWTALFGKGVFALRFPFVLSSLLSLFFLYKTMVLWFSKQRALLATAFFSLTEFSLIQGQLARPYAIGMLFVMTFLWSWTHLLYSNRKRKVHYVGFVLSAIFAAYAHYFSALLVGIIALSGVWQSIKVQFFRVYFLLGAVILLFFALHLPITIGQFSRPSLTSWISEPEPSFLWEHIVLLLNNNILLVTLASALFAVTLYSLKKSKSKERKFMAYSAAFFLLPMVVAYIYSFFSEPVLMHRVLYFSSPFFYVSVLALIPEVRPPVFALRFSFLMSIVLISTLFQTTFLKRDYVEDFKALAEDYADIKRSGSNEVAFIGNFNSIEYLNYYLPEEPIAWVQSSVTNNKELAQMMASVKRFVTDKVAFFWSCKYQPKAALEYINLFYPTVEQEAYYYNSGMWLFSKKQNNRKSLLKIDIEDTVQKPDLEFLDVYKADAVALNEVHILNVQAFFNCEQCSNSLLILSIVGKEGETIKWEGIDLSDFALNEAFNEVFYSFELPHQLNENDQIAIYFWNPGKNEVVFRDISLQAFDMAIDDTRSHVKSRRP